MIPFSHKSWVAGGGGLKRGRLSKEEEKELNMYISKNQFLTPGSEELRDVVEVVQKAIDTLCHKDG